MTVSIVDYGLGNLGSVANMLRRVGAPSRRVSTPEDLLASERVLLPGIGAFDTATTLLRDAGLDDALREFAASGRPLFGICLGMQLLVDSSAEGESRGLGLLPGHCVRFSEDAGVRVPHMGWSRVALHQEVPLTAGLPEDARFYFVHTFHVVPARTADTLGTSEYGDRFVSMISRDNVMGAQFHPEKSHTFGMKILENFSRL